MTKVQYPFLTIKLTDDPSAKSFTQALQEEFDRRLEEQFQAEQSMIYAGAGTYCAIDWQRLKKPMPRFRRYRRPT